MLEMPRLKQRCPLCEKTALSPPPRILARHRRPHGRGLSRCWSTLGKSCTRLGGWFRLPVICRRLKWHRCRCHFFVLSGFVLARSLGGNSDPVRFFRNRLFRLFPAAVAVVALLAALHWQFGLYVGYEASFDLPDVILNMLLIRTDINSVMWSMTVECAATPMILLSFWLVRVRGERPLWGLIVILLLLSSWGPYVHLLGGFANLSPLYAFIVGVLIHFRGAPMASRICPRLANVAAIVAIALF